jgi:hypothetical protein
LLHTTVVDRSIVVDHQQHQSINNLKSTISQSRSIKQQFSSSERELVFFPRGEQKGEQGAAIWKEPVLLDWKYSSK